MTVSLLPYDAGSHDDLLGEWLCAEHVAKWWGRKTALGVVSESGAGQCRIIVADGVPVGFIRWHVLRRDELDEAGLSDICEGGVDLDILIGETDYMGRGYGPRALEAAVTLIQATLDPQFYILCTSPENARAVSAYRKAGFSIVRTFDDPTYGTTLLLRRMGA